MKSKLKNILLVILGTLVLSFGTAVFILPNDLIMGGVSGYVVIIANIIPLKFLTVDLIVTILTWVLFFLGFIVLGKNFALKTLVSTIVYPIATSLFLRFTEIPALADFFTMKSGAGEGINMILAAIFGGASIGAGCAITFLGGGSTGGVDILAFTLCKIFKRLKSSVAMFIIDTTSVVLGMFVLRDFALTLLGVLATFICAVLIDRIFLGSNKSYVAQIVTTKEKEISEAIIKDIDRTTTIINAVGGYSGNEYKLLMVSIKAPQYGELMNIINKIDPKAFMTIYKVHEINGEGWTH